MEEEAKEELRKLEAQYPNRYEYLKLELKSFIFLLQSQSHQTTTSIITSTALTQESTSKRKRKKGRTEYHSTGYLGESTEEDQSHQQLDEKKEMTSKRSCDRAEVVLERARTCLRKIKHLKASLLPCSPVDS
ncbi:hypothetical protein PanWU01x14_046990 [Parasponia andersonii]|uniref:Uncharacterized protein n=1 Tax=Parasponia andersonii TaxID=3476 RepID=A0A2P5DNW3_PARAD|nr:hypothetical protein PanWU01x14_046990 [Parasponia andersonii]